MRNEICDVRPIIAGHCPQPPLVLRRFLNYDDPNLERFSGKAIQHRVD